MQKLWIGEKVEIWVETIELLADISQHVSQSTCSATRVDLSITSDTHY